MELIIIDMAMVAEAKYPIHCKRDISIGFVGEGEFMIEDLRFTIGGIDGLRLTKIHGSLSANSHLAGYETFANWLGTLIVNSCLTASAGRAPRKSYLANICP